jgi:hypothetical protein
MTRITLSLPDKIASQYDSQTSKGQTVEDLMADRLKQAVKWGGKKPIFLTDEHRKAVERLVGKNLSTAHQLVMAVERLATLKIGEVHVDLPTQLADRIATRAVRRPVQDVIREQVTQGLEQFVGLR